MDTIIFVVATITAIIASFYFFAQSQVDELKKNWVQYRCNPVYMPVAGLVGDDVMSNFTKCTMKGFHDYVGFVMDPIMGEFSVLNDTISEIGTTMVSMRTMFSGVRGGFLSIVGSVFGKIQNMMAQTQYIMIRMRTLMSRVVGIMYTFIYIFYGGMQTGLSVANGPVGSTMSFLCFDENTQIQTFDGIKPMKDVVLGDYIAGNFSRVTSIYSIDGTGIQMYSLGGILVTGSHKVKHKEKFIRVDKHPHAKKSTETSKRLVCLNTDNHRINIRNHVFLDFVETDDSTFVDFKNKYIQAMYNGIPSEHEYGERTGLFFGTKISLKNGITKEIQDIRVGDILDNNDTVKGVCAHLISGNRYVEVAKGVLATRNTMIYSGNKMVKANTLGNHAGDKEESGFIVFQLITESSMYPVIGNDNSRTLIIDELETTEPFFHEIKDTIITTGSFRGKLIVV